MSDKECADLGLPFGCKQEFSPAQFIEYVKKECQELGIKPDDCRQIGFVVTPPGEAKISNKIRECLRNEQGDQK